MLVGKDKLRENLLVKLKVIKKIFNDKVLCAAIATDVYALGQVAHFDLKHNAIEEKNFRAINFFKANNKLQY